MNVSILISPKKKFQSTSVNTVCFQTLFLSKLIELAEFIVHLLVVTKFGVI